MSVQNKVFGGMFDQLQGMRGQSVSLENEEYSAFYDANERYFSCAPSLEYRFFKQYGFVFGKEVGVGCETFRDMEDVYKEFYYHKHPEERPQFNAIERFFERLFGHLV
jgi:hypothetical protein